MELSGQLPSPPSLEALLERALELLEAGDHAAVAELAAAHPDASADLTRRLALLSDSGLLPEPDRAEEPPERIGPFELRGRLGAGAMGVVWRAYQDPPGREVALKVIRPEQLLFESSRARFVREVQLAARLSHPSVLPVLAVGEDDGLPWFAMELVEGISLAELVSRVRAELGANGDGEPERGALQRLDMARVAALVGAPPGTRWKGPDGAPYPNWRQFALATVRALASALDHAHSRGVLHRDVKPQNALVHRDGRVWLCDFGLASDGEDLSLTATRGAVGSLPYMAPEVLQGAPADVRADVYGLGALAFELLLLRRPYGEARPAALLAAILGDAMPKVLAMDPGLGADGAAVLETALAKDPQRRYPNAAAFADDLSALLSGRPTRARPQSAAMRVLRSARRHPSRAAAISLTALLVLGGPLAYGWHTARTNRQLEAERNRTVAAEQARAELAERSAKSLQVERDRALLAYEQAMDAVDRMLSRLGEDLAYVPAMERLRERMLEDAVALLQALLAEPPEGSSARGHLELARAQGRLGELENLLGRAEASARSFGAAHEMALASFRKAPNTQAADLALRALVSQVRALGRAGDLSAAHQAASTARESVLPELLRSEVEGTQAALWSAHLDAAQGWVHLRMGAREQGLSLLSRAAEALDAALALDGSHAPVIGESFEVWSTLALESLRADGDRPSAETRAIVERCLDLAIQRASRSPGPAEGRDLVASRINLGGIHLRTRELDQARQVFETAFDEARTLVSEHPATLTLRSEWATAANQLGLTAELDGRLLDSGRHYDQAAAILEELCQLAPSDPGFHYHLALAQLNASAPHKRRGDTAMARDRVELARAAIHQARELSPKDASYADLMLSIYGARWVLCHDERDHGGIAAAAEEMLQLELPEGHRRMALHRAAYAFAVAFDLARADPAIADGYARRACELTQASFEAGNRYRDLRALRNLEALHGHPEFEALLVWFETARGEASPEEPR